MRPAALHLTASVRQWRKALEAGPLTNAKRGGKAKGKRTMAAAAAATADAAADASSAPAETPKKFRASMYSRVPDGDVPWPSCRLNRGMGHRLGWHGTGSRNTYCDYPLCNSVEKTCTRAAVSPADAANMPPPPPRFSGASSTAGSSRAPSPAPSDASSACSTASTRGAIAKTFCMDCYDPSGTRPMNLHAECWCLWHGLCREADDE